MNNNEISFLYCLFIVVNLQTLKWETDRDDIKQKKKIIRDNELQDETFTWRAASSCKEKFSRPQLKHCKKVNIISNP